MKLERQPGSSRESTPDLSRSESGPSNEQEVQVQGQGEHSGSDLGGHSSDEGQRASSEPPVDPYFPPSVPVEQGTGTGDLVAEIRSLRDSVERLHKRHTRTEQRVKAVEGECKGRKRSRSSDISSSEEVSISEFTKVGIPSRRRSSSSSSESEASTRPRGVRDINRDFSWGASIPIDAAVQEKIKKRIWKGKFVDFRYLLDPEERPTKQRKLQLKISAVDSEVHTVAAQEPGPLADFELWDKAFHVFLSITMKGSNDFELLDNLLISGSQSRR